jgi:hypothetical protein
VHRETELLYALAPRADSRVLFFFNLAFTRRNTPLKNSIYLPPFFLSANFFAPAILIVTYLFTKISFLAVSWFLGLGGGRFVVRYIPVTRFYGGEQIVWSCQFVTSGHGERVVFFCFLVLLHSVV